MIGTRVYVGGLSYRVSERDIDKFFKGFSGVGDIVIKNGFAFVEFEDRREAEDAIYEMNGKELMGGRVTVEKAKGTPRASRWPRGGGGVRGMSTAGRMQRRMPQRSRYGMPSRTKHRLMVTNLSSQVSWQDLKDFMRQGGEVTYADAHKQRKNEGMIEFATHSDLRNAMNKLDGKDLRGRRIRLYDESDHGERSRAYDRSSRSRSRSQTRSRSRSSRSKSRSASRSRSRTPRSRSQSRSQTPKRERNSRSRSRSKSRSSSRSRTPRRSPSRSSHSMEKNARSRTRSQSPMNARYPQYE